MAAEMVAMPRLPGCTAELVGAHTCQWAVEPVYTSRALYDRAR